MNIQNFDLKYERVLVARLRSFVMAGHISFSLLIGNSLLGYTFKEKIFTKKYLIFFLGFKIDIK